MKKSPILLMLHFLFFFHGLISMEAEKTEAFQPDPNLTKAIIELIFSKEPTNSLFSPPSNIPASSVCLPRSIHYIPLSADHNKFPLPIPAILNPDTKNLFIPSQSLLPHCNGCITETKKAEFKQKHNEDYECSCIRLMFLGSSSDFSDFPNSSASTHPGCMAVQLSGRWTHEAQNITVINTRDNKTITLKDNYESISRVCFNKDKSLLIATSYQPEIRIFELNWATSEAKFLNTIRIPHSDEARPNSSICNEKKNFLILLRGSSIFIAHLDEVIKYNRNSHYYSPFIELSTLKSWDYFFAPNPSNNSPTNIDDQLLTVYDFLTSTADGNLLLVRGKEYHYDFNKYFLFAYHIGTGLRINLDPYLIDNPIYRIRHPKQYALPINYSHLSSQGNIAIDDYWKAWRNRYDLDQYPSKLKLCNICFPFTLLELLEKNKISSDLKQLIMQTKNGDFHDSFCRFSNPHLKKIYDHLSCEEQNAIKPIIDYYAQQPDSHSSTCYRNFASWALNHSYTKAATTFVLFSLLLGPVNFL